MRVRSERHSKETRRRGGPTSRPSVLRRDQPAIPVAEPEVAPEDDDLADERRLRASGGPNDRAQYACVCGYVWQTDVSASVSCPHCGTPQAW
ncbi:MAG: hypothetical protein QOH46_14 [Solirubrobacteraceae bacterium]|jgi:hypothetical protein|nr:hypothetical protein [Solirubrobacteraceae bacterium]MEA2245485.1 hypothetical protein [Solirubrobacteraceae bacterium]